MSVFKNINVAYVYVKNWEAAKKFYSELLGWPVAYSDDEMGWQEFGAEGEAHFAISLWEDKDSEPARGVGMTIVFTVEDVPAAVRDLRAKGVRCEDPVVIPGVVTIGTFYDPEGNRLQMASGG